MSVPRPDPLDAPAAERLARAARAARALSETLWEALQEELSPPGPSSGPRGEGPGDASHAAALCERLGEVAATLTLLAGLPAQAGAEAQTPPAAQVPAASPPAADSSPPRSAPSATTPVPPASSPAPGVPEEESLSARARLIDELAPAPPERSFSPMPSQSLSPPAPPESLSSPAPSEFPAAPGPSEPPVSPVPAPPEIAIRDERHEEARRRVPVGEEEPRPDPWVAAIARRVEGHERDRLPFAVLAVELADVERLRQAELPGEVARLTGLVESALAGQLGPADSLTRATPGRYWLLAAQTDAEAARALAQRLAQAVRGAVQHRGAPLEIAVGVAACPADATRAGALAAHAEIALYAARAAGRPVAP